ncbi:3'-5' exoribonuclease HELZ2 [Hyperolius riggenbachi]|uniref:3'-5' exoribonuclease HELZ2 n=1 Tax=Hyperolius riggenbachi TaxID=752182 RepID=UPI0035A388B2
MGQFTGLVPPNLQPLLENVELRLSCALCCKKTNGFAYTYKPCSHICAANLLLSRPKHANNSTEWREVRRRPYYPVPARYAVCWHYHPINGCSKHYQRCTFAWTIEEVHVWSFEKHHNLERNHLLSLLQPTPALRPSFKVNRTWEDLLNEFGGQFVDICEQCFYQIPRKVTQTSKCQSHPRPVPFLAHIVIKGSATHCHTIRPMPYAHHMRLCDQSSKGLLCREESGHCPNAHSEVELAVWKLEQEHGLSRSGMRKDVREDIGFHCRLCLVSASTQERFEEHCSSLEHGRMLADDSLPVWNYRKPPLGIKQFALCECPQQCIYGEGCQKAHSQEELQEWILREKVSRRNKLVVEEEGLQSYQERLLQEYRLHSSSTPVLSEEVEYIQGVKITCDRPLTSHSQQKPVTTVWNFTIHTQMALHHVALLKSDPGAVFRLDAQGLPKSCHYAGGSHFKVKGFGAHYNIRVSAECLVFGVFEQWLALDFGIRPVLLQKIFVQVGGQEDTSSSHGGTPLSDASQLSSSECWNPSKILLVPCMVRTQEEKKLLDLYKPPSTNPSYCGRNTKRQVLTVANYREMMHQKLLQEEAAREEVISRLNLKTQVTFTKMVTLFSQMSFAQNGELFAQVPIPKCMTQDTEEGYLLQRSVTTAWVAPCSQQGHKVYEVHVEHKNELESSVILRFPERCCRELSLQAETPTKLEIQFQLDRLIFCMYHEAVDRLRDVTLLLPDLTKCCVPTSQVRLLWANDKQHLAISYISGKVLVEQPVAPLVIYGPFGTGKTSTLAKAALEVIRAGARVLICTHNNSAADLYIEEHFHPYVGNGHPEATPLRVKYTKSPVNRTTPITLQYCVLSDDRSCFLKPTLALLDKRRIVIATAVTARDLDVPRGYFTHILLDEAAQMMECEALIPLTLADHRTRIVVAGDHMQETPRFFQRTDVEEQTLLTRLFSYYQSKTCPVAKTSRIVFHQNYRSVPAIISFVSRYFYVGRDDAIESCAVQPMNPPEGCHALSLFHVHGSCAPMGNSWTNVSEVLQVVDVTKDVIQRWPETWGRVDRSKICVVSHGSQVAVIRQELRKVYLRDVVVTNYDNIIGQEFLVIILSTVRSLESLPTHPPAASTFSLDFFCDPRVLNTILTRARAQVIVVGDVVALCSFGACSRIWRNYLRECVEAGSASPPDLSVEDIKQMACEQQAWRQQHGEEDSDEDSDSWAPDLDLNAEDAILRELLDSKNEACVTVSAEGILEMRPEAEYSKDEDKRKDKYTNFSRHILDQYLQTQPDAYKRCQLVKDYFDRGYAVTLDENSPRHIAINGRKNCGMGFSGDQVVVQLLPGVHPEAGKVVGILEAGEKTRRYICTIETYDSSIMVPQDRSVTKIFCFGFKSKPGYIPIREIRTDGSIRTIDFQKVTQEMRRNTLFLVQVINWREGYYYPLGIVTKILPPLLTLEKGLDVLALEFGIEKGSKYPKEASKEADRLSTETLQTKDRNDCRKMLTFTVDPAHAKDLDDAISVQDQGDNYEIGIHITDLTAVIPKGSGLDREAKRRSVTFYSHIGEPVHMLPPKLCSDLCSLKPGCDRLAVSLFVSVDKHTDQMLGGYFCHSVIRSDHQLSYDEANSILKAKRESPQTFETVEGCICIAEHFSKVHRFARLEKAANYKQPDEDSMPGSRDAQRMIEELMIMYNSWVAEFLMNQEHSMTLTPVRCQKCPNFQKIEELRKKFERLLPFSAYLSHHLLEEPELPRPFSEQRVTMLTSVWNQLKDAAENNDHSKITDLLTAEDLHPELSYAVREFRSQLGRSYFTCSGTLSATVHYSLQLCEYTWASSPLRRYIDIVVQRLLEKALVVQSEQTLMSSKEMDLLCLDFDKKCKRESSYEKRAHALRLAMSLWKEGQQKIAVIMAADAKNRSFKAAFPLNGDSLPNLIPLDYSHLQPVDQPQPTKNGFSLSWKRRVYSYIHFKSAPLKNVTRKDIITFNPQALHDAMKAINEGSPKEAMHSLAEGQEKFDPMSHVWQSTCGHYLEFTLELKPGDTLPVHLCTALERGFPSPILQLCTLVPGIQLCLEHTSRPIDCFSSLANRAPLKRYRNVRDYQSVWQPLCAMEAVESAVKEGGSVLLRDVPIEWDRKTGSKQAVGLKGTFKLRLSLIEECDLEMDFQHCYLCVRMEDLPAGKTEDLSSLQTYTWVAHALTESSSSISKDKGGHVDFQIHQSTMKEVPEAVLASRDLFTIEIIPKLLPDIRKEYAIGELQKASELTKNIMLGKQVPDVDMNKAFQEQRSFVIPETRRELNDSQTEAIRKALTQPFTLIQGPPGTGKTVVGAHLVYWFHHLNQDITVDNTEKGEEIPARRILMYCGPSNKSVDVVGEMLLPLWEKLRPLRVYSEQIELSEFPYPGSNRRVSGYIREGKPNEKLRPITLHHLIREPGKPYARKIREMDERIRIGEEMSAEDVAEYKDLLSKARKEELTSHDIILCTCVASSGKILADLPVTQVVIDECGMCTEPEALVPLVSHKLVKSIVLIGDHRQLRPVVMNDVCRLLKVDRSLFERYEEQALFLDTQYRMHAEICAFPSKEFYDGRLRTYQRMNLQLSLFCCGDRKHLPILFGEVTGQEESLVVATEQGNLNSKANLQEAKEAVRLSALLVRHSVDPKDIAILTAYNAQVSEITKRLEEARLRDVTVSTIMKSQGSEWRYVIFSTVRSVDAQELDSYPTLSWQRKYLGFLGDPNQINVALTRAKEGLCVLGNPKLLRCCRLWEHLLQHYGKKGVNVHAADIGVSPARRR